MTATVFMVLALDALPDDDRAVIADNEAAMNGNHSGPLGR